MRKLKNSNHSPSYGSKREGASRAHLGHAFTFRAITRAVVGISQFSQRILKAEEISNRKAHPRSVMSRYIANPFYTTLQWSQLKSGGGLQIGYIPSFQNPLRKLKNSNHSTSYTSKREGTSRAHQRHAVTFRAITWAVVGIFQFSQRILKAEKISNREAALRFELSPLESGLKRVRDISRHSQYNTIRTPKI